jgi:hypothetical protein
MGDNFRTHIAALITGLFLLVLSFVIFAIGLLGEVLSYESRSKTYWIRKTSPFTD